MKATYYGVTMEGTPKEIHELMRLIEAQHKTKSWDYPNPYMKPYPWFGIYPPTTTGGYVPAMTGITSNNTTKTYYSANTAPNIMYTVVE